MYLHIGQDWLVPYAAIIGIFRTSLLDSSPHLRYYVARLRSEGRVRGEEKEAKTLILTDDLLYFSSVSTTTLERRSHRRMMPLE